MPRLLAVIIVVLVLTFGSRRARAEDGPPTTAVEGYAASVMAADVLSFTMLGIGFAAHSDTVGSVGLAGFALAAPAVHLTEGQPGHAAASLALRVALPFLGFSLGASLGRRNGCEDCEIAPALLGGGLGLLTAMVIDYTLLASKTVERPSRTLALAVSPTVAVTPAGTSFGLLGCF